MDVVGFFKGSGPGGGQIAGQIEEEKKVRDDGRGKDSKRRGKGS